MPSNISLNFTYLMKFRQVFKIDTFHQLHGNFISMEAFDGIFFFWTLKSFLRKRTLTLTETAANKNVEIHAYDPAGQYLAVKET